MAFQNAILGAWGRSCVRKQRVAVPIPPTPFTARGAGLVVAAVAGSVPVTAALAPGFITYDQVRGSPYTFSYTNRSYTVNGTPTLLLSGCMHYVRSTPAQWPDLMAKLRADGLNSVETYFFWRAHELRRGQPWSFDFNADIGRFLQAAAGAGLFVTVRIGPYICGEHNGGGLPSWVFTSVGGNLTTRSSEPTWLGLMSTVYRAAVDTVRPFLTSAGGPVTLLQVENEYGE